MEYNGMAKRWETREEKRNGTGWNEQQNGTRQKRSVFLTPTVQEKHRWNWTVLIVLLSLVACLTCDDGSNAASFSRTCTWPSYQDPYNVMRYVNKESHRWN